MTYAKPMTMKSNQFQASLRYVKGSKINPRANNFINASHV